MTDIQTRLGSQVPTFRTGPQVSGGAGDRAVDLAGVAGLILDPWQEDVLRAGCAQRADGKWASFEVAEVVPRQNGKGSTLEALELDRLFLDDDTRLILHSAHEMKTAKDAFRRVVGLVDEVPLLKKQVKAVRYTNGDEGIELQNGRRLRFVARSTGSGRGFSADLIVLDEAYNLSEDAMSAMLPTLSARPNAQIWYTSSAPLLIPQSAFLRKLIKRGRAGGSRDLTYFEWCARHEDALDDRDAWGRANPGMGIRISEESIGREFEILTPEDFGRERLGIWSEDDDTNRIISSEDWEKCRDPESRPSGPVVFALDVSPDRVWSTIVMAAKSDRGGIHGEITGNDEVYDHRRGTDWVVGRVAELQARWGGKVAIAERSPAWSLKEDLEVAKVDLLPVSPETHSQACGDVYDAVVEGRLRHIGQGELDAAVAGADRRYYGDAWLWSRRTSNVDISPLVALTLAHWEAQKQRPKPTIHWREAD